MARRLGSGARSLHDLKGIVQLSVGDSHACAIDRGGLTHCWGSNEYGERGGTGEPAGAPVRVPDVSNARSVAAGRHTSCVVLTSTEVWCWGATPSKGAPRRATGSPERIEGASGAVSVALGPSTACVVDTAGQLHCWGAAIAPSETSRRVPGFSDVAAVSIGAEHLCAALRSGHVRCTGKNARGELGTLELRDVSFSDVPDLSDVSQITVGDYATCALVRGTPGELACWAMTRR